MYADRHARSEGIKPVSLAVAIAVNAGLVGALLFVTPVFQVIDHVGSLTVTNVPITPPPPPEQIEATTKPDNRAATPPERMDLSRSPIGAGADVFVALRPLPFPPFDPLPSGGGVTIDPPVAPPVLVEAQIDARYTRHLQPIYPAGERRAEREGFATVRVTIGRDGRVTNAECERATNDAFCRATLNQALSKWRFQPATRDGVAIESSVSKTVRFELAS